MTSVDREGWERHRCGDRDAHPVGLLNKPDGMDSWVPRPDGTRVCSWCGSLHPDDARDIFERYADCEEGYSVDLTTKEYKIYAHRPGVCNASEGGIKFYGWHAPTDEAFHAALSAATARCLEERRALWTGPQTQP